MRRIQFPIIFGLLLSLLISACNLSTPTTAPKTLEPYLVQDGHKFYQLETGQSTKFSVFVEDQCVVVEVAKPVSFVVLEMSEDATIENGTNCQSTTTGIRIEVKPYGGSWKRTGNSYVFDDSSVVTDYARQLTHLQKTSVVVGEIFIPE